MTGCFSKARGVAGSKSADFILILLLWITSNVGFCSAATDSASDPLSELMAATFKITDKNSSGACLILAPPTTCAWPSNTVVLVTTAHTFENMPGERCFIIGRGKATGHLMRTEIPVQIRSGAKSLWTKHLEVDLAVLKVEIPRGAECKPLPLERLAEEHEFSDGTIRLGATTWVSGFPAQLEANELGLPVLRHGSVASLPLASGEGNKTFLVDMSTFGGDSGGAVVTYAGPQPRLVGLVLGMHRQTDKVTMPFEERTVHYPLGLAIVLNPKFIRQAVEQLGKS